LYKFQDIFHGSVHDAYTFVIPTGFHVFLEICVMKCHDCYKDCSCEVSGVLMETCTRRPEREDMCLPLAAFQSYKLF